MKLWGYLKGKRMEIALIVLITGIFFVAILLYQLPLQAAVYPSLLSWSVLLIAETAGYFRSLRRQEEIETSLHSVRPLPAAVTPVEETCFSIIEKLRQQVQDTVSAVETERRDMESYYTLWIHQIKTPIAAMHLLLDDKDTPEALRLKRELFSIEQYVEMVLAYLRTGAETTDFVFRRCDLDAMLRQSIRKFSLEFISRRIALDYVPVEKCLITDEKWFCFVVDQILSNALKYTPSGSVTVRLEGNTLRITDTGIGIEAEDLPRIFEKGYTGFNGRMDKKASGLGLYLAKRVCGRLNIEIRAESRRNEGSTLSLIFPDQTVVLE